MVEQNKNISKLSTEELMGVINTYPWYGYARMELCTRMSEKGLWTDEEDSDAALYISSRRLISELLTSGQKVDCSDADIAELLKSYIHDAEPEDENGAQTPSGQRVFVVGGDYFSQAQYDKVRRSTDGIFSSFASKESDRVYDIPDEDKMDFCTETLGRIYEQQGYYAEAKEIYSKLSLRYPEKSVYFATLIEKLDKN